MQAKTAHKVKPANGHAHRAARPKNPARPKNGPISVFQVNPAVWQRAVIEAKKHGVKVPSGITIISTTKVEFLCAH
jgi:hypothetical protein